MLKAKIEKNYRFTENTPFVFVRDGVTYGPWTVQLGDFYLHSDGVMRSSCLNTDTGKFTGWYRTRREAREALRKYKLDNGG